MAEHTPGPWEIHFRHREPNIPNVKPYWFYAIEGAEDEAHEANARLIAQAPALLEALKGLQMWIDTYGGPHDEKPKKSIAELMENAQVAIERAS